MEIKKKTRKQIAMTFYKMKLHLIVKTILVDVAKVERSEDVAIDMGTWISRFSKNRLRMWDSRFGSVPKAPCVVCAAGAIAIHRFGRYRSMFHDASVEERALYYAVDALRGGWVASALWHLNRHQPPAPLNYEITPYADSAEKWREDMTTMMAKLKELNL